MKKKFFVGMFSFKTLGIIIILNFFTGIVMGQVKINGKVTRKDGNGIYGVSVLIKNTNIGSSTDVNGDYNLNAPVKTGNYVLQFSGVGFKSYESTIRLGSDQNYSADVQLTDDALSLDEVVVTGTSAGTTRKQLGSYVSTVKADQLNKGASGNVLQALQGKTAGAQINQNSGDPAGGLSVRLRGISSIGSSSEPLYIVDGIIVNNATTRVTNTQGNYDGTNFVGSIGQNRMVDINPADIDHIEVLNGAAAAAIYGSRANAGVIQIFTKKGATGAAPQVNFSTSIQVSQLRKKLHINMAPTKFGGDPNVQTQDILNPSLTNTTAVTRYDYQDYIFQKGTGTDNNVSVSGGSEKTKYYLAGSYFFNQGIIKNTDFQRFSFRANLDQTLSKILSFNLGLNYINSASNEKPDGNSFFSPMNSVTIIGNYHDLFTRDANGNIKAVGERGRTNPVSVIEDFKQRQETNRILANIGLRLKPLKGLSFDYILGIDNYGQNGTTYMPPFAYNVNTAFYGGGPTLDPTLNGYASTGNNQFFQINHEINGNYQFNITSDIGSTTQVGYSTQYEKNKYSLIQGRGLAAFISTVNGASTPLPSVDDRTEISIAGAFIQQNFRFKNKIFLTGAVRRDLSSVFGINERNQVYYKASGSYILSEEGFWKNSLTWWNTFKLRAAYGESGNLTGIGAYERTNAYSSNSYLGRIALSGNSRLANENVKPERQKEIEIGTDISLFKDRLGVQFNWYHKRVESLLINRQTAPTTGYSSLLDNFGSLENKGFEIVLNISPLKRKDLHWDITAIYNHNRNKVLNVGKALTLFSTNAGAPVALLQGYPVGIFYGTFFALDQNGNMVKTPAGLGQIEKGLQTSPTTYTTQRDANGLPTGTTLRKVIGDPNPKYTGSLVNEIGYKNLGLRVQLDVVNGINVFNADFRTRQGVGNGTEAEKEHLGIYPRGYINSIYQIEEWRIDDGAFVKLREISLSYRFGNFKFFKDLSINLSGRNLISWDKYRGYDPEVNGAGQSNLLRAIDFGAVPIPRTFKFGIATKF